MAQLREAREPADVQTVRELFMEYARGVAQPCCFQDFERELAELPRGYLALFLTYEDGMAAGCAALREVDRSTAEMKRLYVRAAFRGLRIGHALYRNLGFRETPPYLSQPTPGASCFELRL